MPIVHKPGATEPLTQGDILSGVKLHVTEKPWEAGGGVSAKAPFNLCLVVSRPCVALHKGYVVVAGVRKFSEDQPRDLLLANKKSDSEQKDKVNYKRVLAFLKKNRDGHGSPDIMYLGQLPAHTGRFAACLDSLHTVQVPAEEEMPTFLSQQRIARLCPEFARDLHSRIFGAFASLGFDDDEWFPDQDFAWLASEIQQDIQVLETEVSKQKAAKASSEAGGPQFDAKKLTEAETALDQLRKETESLRTAYERRTKAAVASYPPTTPT